MCRMPLMLVTALAVACKAAPGVPDLASPETPRVKLGLEVLLDEPAFRSLLHGRRVGLITNQTGLDSQGRRNIDLLHGQPDFTLAALFGPEHGLTGAAGAGEHVGEMVDPATGVVIHSLYGETRRPTPEMLNDVDIMLYDVQDIGARGFTYIYTMAYAMDACGEAGIPFLVLDRPDPCGGDIVDGNVLKPEDYSGFVGLYPIAYMYGMTPGETARLFNGEFLDHPCELTVVPMRGWRRSMRFWDTGLPWVPSTSLMVSPETCFYTIMTGIIGEIRALSIGVGYESPFQVLGAPFIDGQALADAMNAKHLPGVRFEPFEFTPTRAPYQGEVCRGVLIHITDYEAVRPVQAEVHLMEVLNRLCPNQIFDDPHAEEWLFDEVWGDFSIRRRILESESAESIIASWQPDLQRFLARRARYLVYP
jgi:uncharacterized protein YbbC (DUF1343 family)